ncbi:BREX-2 system adenine-specific DNA-methyltransferase PglX [Streptomyces sp. NPDC021969]|uniref:BREX-2 system adenine-specific DNA-methyltransferase PglX n=1 Tax=unclassified Streptomyces TaxID=2593676 RepID=UPI003400DFA8
MSAEGTPGAGSEGSLDRVRLLKDLQARARLLEDDLRARTDDEPEFRTTLRAEYDRAVLAERTAAMYETWRDDRVVQIAAAWVLACVFVRFSEDNGLIPDAWLSGPGERLAEAVDRHDAYFRAHPEKNDRDWLLDAFDALGSSHPTAAGLFDRGHNPLYEVTPSYEAASALLAFWRERGADGEIVHDFTDPELNTRFLGDLYQDLSEHARKTYALLQTPVFVEEFILDLTLEPAVEEFGLTPAWKHRPVQWDGELWDDGPGGEEVVRGLRCIDPACGSGHFLLGLFERLLGKWREAEPGTEPWVLVRRALESVHGADKNPFAVAIARFRLLVAALKAGGVRELGAAPGVPIRVAVADSLLHGRGAETVTESLDTLFAENEPFYYRTEDVEEYAREVDLLGRDSYHVVVGNPPYIAVQDEVERDRYRRAYDTCFRQYQLSAPFAQRFYELAIRTNSQGLRGGVTGQITSNGFARRDFGFRLVSDFFPTVNLTHVIDSSGATIPGHNREGTPTVILIGWNEFPRNATPVRVATRLRAETSMDGAPQDGPAWQAIIHGINQPGLKNDWVSVTDTDRRSLGEHPWMLGGDASDVLMHTISGAGVPLRDLIEETGRSTHTGLDDAFYAPRDFPQRHGMEQEFIPVVLGSGVRDYSITTATVSEFPYNEHGEDRTPSTRENRFLWSNRTSLRERVDFSKTLEERGLRWFDHSMFFARRYNAVPALTYSFKVSHNHFALNRTNALFNRHAPAIILPRRATESDYLNLLAALNSSTVCFWMVSRSQHQGGGAAEHPWSWTYEFSGGIIKDIPVTPGFTTSYGEEIDALTRAFSTCEPSTLARASVPTRESLDEAFRTQRKIRARMIALQEELDWTIYGAYGLLTPEEISRTTIRDVPEISLGERAFEIILAGSGAETAWFERHGATPVTEIPARWPESYRKVVQARIDLIEANKDIRLIERPEYKRRWSIEPWEKREAAALRSWLLDAAEREELWFEEQDGYTVPRPLTVNQLADALRHDEDVQAVATLYAADHLGKRDASLATVLAAVIEAEHVPYAAALRYKDSGLRKRAQWEQVWEQQREEDRTGKRLDIKVPPKYTSADFLKNSYWSNRGKLDVPKERFISYPGASPESDTSLLLGWAGWNHRDQADALVGLIRSRVESGGWEKEDPRFVPLLAGLREVMPWVHQWYGGHDEEWDGNPAEEFQAALDNGRMERGLSESDLTIWRPEKKTRGQQKKSG